MTTVTEEDVARMKKARKSFNVIASGIDCYTEMKMVCAGLGLSLVDALEQAIKMWLKQYKK